MAPGDSIGPYVLGERIGAGGMGEVYRATDQRLHRDVAVKLMREGADAKRFEAEARAAAQLNHPNIIAVLDVGVHQGVPYLVTELLEGRTLRERLSGPFTPDEIKDVAKQLAEGLRAAHARGIVHRDLKPENVFVTTDGRVKILDFGIARVESERSEGTVTATGAVMGTVGYMAPEQVRGLPADARTDLFAFGCILYELLSGCRAFQGATSVETGVAILNAQPAPLPSGAAPAALVMACLEKERERRPASANEVLVALSEGQPVRTLSGTDLRAAAPRSTGTVWKVALGAVVTLAAVTVVATRRQEPAPAPLVVAPHEAPDAGPHLGVSMIDQPLPKSASPEALALYRKALQELHDGSIAEGSELLEQALKLDPMLGAAHLRLCLWTTTGPQDCFEARRLRSTLSPRDQALLDAFGPIYEKLGFRDVDAGVAREEALLRRFPDDAEAVLLAAIYHPVLSLAELPSSLAIADRALELDPGFAAVYWVRGAPLSAAMTQAQRKTEFEHCLAIAPQGAACLRNLARASAVAGECAELERYAERGIQVEPDGKLMRCVLFDAKVANGASREEVDALGERWPEVTRRRFLGVETAMSVAAWRGDFTDARTDGGVTLGTRVFLAHVADESGDAAEVQRQVRAFVAERKTVVARREEIMDTFDGPMLALALRTRALSPADVERTLESLLREAPSLGTPRLDYATEQRLYLATTPEEARAALAMLESGTPEVRADWLGETNITAYVIHGLFQGRVDLLAGDVDGAIAALKGPARTCYTSDTAVLFVQQARLELGTAYERKGDTAAACDWYGKVVAQWGHAKPRSVTAEKAKARMKALHCGP